MKSHLKLLGTIFAFSILVIGLAPLINNNTPKALALDFDISDFRCIAVIGQQNCNTDNRTTEETTTTNNVDNSTTTNNVDNSTTTNNNDNRSGMTDNSINDSCNGQATNDMNQSGQNDTAINEVNQDICSGLTPISLPI